MKRWFVIGGLILSNVVSILLYVGSLDTIHSQENTMEMNEQQVIAQTDEQAESDQYSSDGQVGNQMNDEGDPFKSNGLDFIKETFRMIFDYNNENYLSRFDTVEGRTTDEILHHLRGMSGDQTPESQFENHVETMKVYVSPSPPDQRRVINALVYMTSTYEIEGSDPTERNQIFHVRVKKQGDDYSITRLESYGYINPLSQS